MEIKHHRMAPRGLGKTALVFFVKNREILKKRKVDQKLKHMLVTSASVYLIVNHCVCLHHRKSCKETERPVCVFAVC